MWWKIVHIRGNLVPVAEHVAKDRLRPIVRSIDDFEDGFRWSRCRFKIRLMGSDPLNNMFWLTVIER
jgi:hypothetical protein